MYPKQHIILGFIFSLIIFLIFPQIELIGFTAIFLSSFLIDVDHYLVYVIKKKDWNLKNAYNWYIDSEKKFQSLSIKEQINSPFPLFVLHGIEILVLIALLGIFISRLFLFIFVGFSFHLLLDAIHIYFLRFNHDRFSLIYSYIKLKKQKT